MKNFKIFVLTVFLMTFKSNNIYAQNSCCASNHSKQCSSDSTKTLIIKVKGINCSMDLKSISTNVEKLKGVNSCKSLKMGTTSTFEVNFNPALVTEKEIHEAIENTSGCENPEEKPYKVKQ